MARPKKLNAEFFPHDVDMRNDLKVKALRNKFGPQGYAYWCMTLEHLGNCNYFEYEWTELNIELLATDFNISSDELNDFVAYCMKLELLQIDNGFLTCNRFTERLVGSLGSKRDDFSMENSKRFKLLDSLSDGNYINDEFTEDKHHGNTQSKVKESKGNKSTLHETKVKCSEGKESEVQEMQSLKTAISELTQIHP